MKKLKQVIAQIKALPAGSTDELSELLWQYICYSPKMPLRLVQEQLLQGAEKCGLTAADKYFTGTELTFNTFKWGKGNRKVLLTHGWGSKAADFNELITALNAIPDMEIIAFDAPGSGSSEGWLSNLLLFSEAIKAVISHYGLPDVIIGHSLGAMANIYTIQQMEIVPAVLVSITPLLKLKENFEASMNALNIAPDAQNAFFAAFLQRFGVPATHFTLENLCPAALSLNHWLAYDVADQVAPYAFLKEFLDDRPQIAGKNYEAAGHDKMIKSPEMIADLVEVVKAALLPKE